MLRFGPNIKYQLINLGCQQVPVDYKKPAGDRMTVLELTFVTDERENGDWIYEPKTLLVKRDLINPIGLSPYNDPSTIYVEWEKKLPDTRADNLAQNITVNLYAHPDWIKNEFETACR